MVFIYQLEDHKRYAPHTNRVFEALELGTLQGVISTIVLLELLVLPFKKTQFKVADEYENLLTTYPNLRVLPVTDNIAVRAATLRAKHGIATPDAIIIATALEGGATALVTNDIAFQKVSDIDVLLLDEAIANN